MRGTLAAALLLAGAFSSARAGGLAIVGTELRDNGDHDGYADTNETVELWLTVKNTTAQPLTGVVANLSIASGPTVCLLDGTASIGSVAPGAEVRAAEPLIFHVASDQSRATLAQVLTASFNLSFSASPVTPAATPPKLVFDLDLDVTGGGAPSTWTEDFEAGFGAFSVQNLDFGLHDDTPYEENLTFPRRCQYHSPLCGATCQGTAAQCSLGGTAAAADAIWWRVDGPSAPGGGRGYSGTQSLYFGEPLGPALGYTTPAGALEAAAMTAPIHLAAGRWCSNAAATACTDDAACPEGGTCAEVVPALSFKHQVSFLDNRSISNVPPGGGQALDRGVVAVQLADPSGAALGPWMRIEPSINIHDTVATPAFSNCTFDPIDDGNDEDDLDPPYLPIGDDARRGPSSTCADEPIFAYIGSTQGAFSAAAVGRADGPGLQGSSGPGTWIETRYDLSRFRGRYVRVRFLASTTRFETYETWQTAFNWNPRPGDDGWWIDDVTISGMTATAGTLAIDTHDNSGLAPDGDADGMDDFCDNCIAAANPSQTDLDADTVGDACDSCTDTDADGFGNPGSPANTCILDNCPSTANPTQVNSDLDALGDACDNCPMLANADQANADLDPMGDACDCAPADAHTYSNAPEWNDARTNQCPGDAGQELVDELSGGIGFRDPANKNRLSWTPQTGATQYLIQTVLASSFPSSPPSGPWCNPLTTANPWHDTTPVTLPGVTRFYIVRAQLPNRGSAGRTSAGVERGTLICN